MSELSPARLEANRANAQKSTGPNTPEGKAKSALNSLVHGLRASTVVLPGEDAEVFEALRQDLIDEHKPQTVTEQRLLDTMAASQWALDRARRQEVAALTQRMLDAVAQCDPADAAACAAAYDLAQFDDSKEGVLRLRYMIAQDSIYNRALRNLMSLRRQRQREEKAAETSRRRQEREEQAAAKRSVPSEPKPVPQPPPSPPRERWEMDRPAPAPVELPAYSSPRTAPTAPSRC